jgi:poly(hydroxyalkanoate) depolymerase family esterase
MRPDFERAMRDAARLVQGGRLDDATAAIQAALGGASAAPAAADDREVVDVEARVLPDVIYLPGPAGWTPATPRPEPAARAAGDTFSGGTFRNDCGARDYKLFVPAGADGDSRPLVVMLHGCTQDPDDFARGTRMNELARSQGFLVLYPAQSRRGNAQGCWNWFKHNHQARGRGEPGILAGMVRAVGARHGADPRRVYVAGLSAGGAMAAILGEAYPELFAAVGVHSGLAAGAATDMPSAFAAMNGSAPPMRAKAGTAGGPPTIVFHGDADTTVKLVNADRVAQAAGASRGGEAVRGTRNGRAFTQRVFAGGRIEQWTVHGAGHAWSGGSPSGSYADPQGPDASAEMLRFFLAHPG